MNLRLAALAQGRARHGFVAALTGAFVIGAGGTDLLACPACFDAEEAPLIDAARLGVLVMLGITLAVQGAFAGFFLYLRNHAKRTADSELDAEWADLQKPSRTS